MNSGWQLAGDAPTAYTRFAYKIMEPWTDDLIRSANCRDGDRVLDVACGTGVVANRVNLVTGKSCVITGIDLNEAMLGAARSNPQIEWHQGSANDLPFDPGSFDVVLCQQGLQYFPDRAAAMKEMARVLFSGARLAINVWAPSIGSRFMLHWPTPSRTSLARKQGLPSPTWHFRLTRLRNCVASRVTLASKTSIFVSNIGRCAIPPRPG